MQKKLMFTYIFIITIVLVITAYTSVNSSQKALENQIKDSFVSQLNLLSDLLIMDCIESKEQTYADFAEQYAAKADLRITVINTDGKVLADSLEDEDTLENHLHRAEIVQAMENKNGLGYSSRYSETVGIFYLYYAQRIEYKDEFVLLRISKPLTELDALKNSMLNSSMNGVIVVFITSMLIAFVFSRIFLKPINKLNEAVNEISKGNYNKVIPVSSYDEVGQLSEAFNTMSRELRYTVLQLKDKNTKMESILNSMTNGVIAVDKNLNILLINPLCYKILGITQSDILNLKIKNVVANESILEIVQSAIEEKKPYFKELNYEDKVLRIYATPISYEESDRQNTGSVLVIDNVTQIRKLEQMRSDFVSNVTHELKTPLTSIKGFVDTLKNGAINEPDVALHFLDIIEIEANRLTSLIQDILSLSEIESRDKEINTQDFLFQDITEYVYKMLKPYAESKNLLLEIHSDKIPIIHCNPERLKQLIINLVDNALKYTEKGRVDVFINEDNGALKITVKDTGIGIPKESLPRIFERFYRVDKGRSRKIGGTGLGLSIVKHIVLLYKGTINVESTLGMGTTFFIHLPVIKR